MSAIGLHTTDELGLKRLKRREHRRNYLKAAGWLALCQFFLWFSISQAHIGHIDMKRVFYLIMTFCYVGFVSQLYRFDSRKLIYRYRGWYKLQMVVLTLPTIIVFVSRIL